MNEKEKGESYIRWQGFRINQFSFVNNLLITLATGLIAFETQLVFNKDIQFSYPEKWGWIVSVILLTISLFGGVYLAWNRLQDFREKAKTTRQRGKKLDNRINEARSYTKELGGISWALLKYQMTTGGLSGLLIIVQLYQKLS